MFLLSLRERLRRNHSQSLERVPCPWVAGNVPESQALGRCEDRLTLVMDSGCVRVYTALHV